MGSVGSRSDLRRFAVAVVTFAILFGAVGRIWGEDIALRLQDTPTTEFGWLFIGWLVSGPPCIIAILVWHERRRFKPESLRTTGILIAAWIGLSMFVFPARLEGVDSQFGTGALANVIGLVFAALVWTVLHRTVPGKPTAEQLDLTARLLEKAWLVLMVVSLGFALYGKDAGLFHSGT